jgi:hypothetical protein
MCDKPILVFMDHPVVLLFSMTNLNTSAQYGGILLLAKVAHTELGRTF